MPDIDPVNQFLVGAQGDTVIVAVPPARMTRHEALRHAAWLVAIADIDDEFDRYLEAVRRT